MLSCPPSGAVAERLNAPVLKTGVPKGIVSSNLTGPASAVRRLVVQLPRTASAQQLGVS